MNNQPLLVSTADSAGFWNKFSSEIFTPIITVIIFVTVIYFIFGVGKFLLALNQADQDGISKGRNHLLYGFIGLFISTSAYAIFKFLATLFGNTFKL